MNTYNNDLIGTFHRDYNTTYKTNVWCNSQAYPLYGDTDISYYVVKPRNIKWLCHFTPRANLADIMVNGLKTRDLIPFEAEVTDTNRFDRNSNAICLSVSKPNSWMLHRKLDIGFDLCLLLIDPAVLSNKECAFFPHNAATACYRNLSFEEMTGVDRFEAMFESTVSVTKANGSINTFTRQNNFLDCETTSEQAEIQCRENIEPEYIRYIIEDNFPFDALGLQKLAKTYENKIVTKEIITENTGGLLSTVENIASTIEKAAMSAHEAADRIYHRVLIQTEKSLKEDYKTHLATHDEIAANNTRLKKAMESGVRPNGEPLTDEMKIKYKEVIHQQDEYLADSVLRQDKYLKELDELKEERKKLHEKNVPVTNAPKAPGIQPTKNSTTKQNHKTNGSKSKNEYNGCLPFIILAIIVAMFAL